MTTTRRVFCLILDSFGLGASLDAEHYGDAGADTFGHIHEVCAQGLGDKKGLRKGPLMLPNLQALGLYHAALASTGIRRIPPEALTTPQGYYGYAVEQSVGKDTPSGHWELAGQPLHIDWGYFPETIPCFPKELINQLITEAGLPGVLGQKHASGTVILEELGEEHCKTGQPIIYTSGDSVFQIAAHEETFGLERLFMLCEKARLLVNKYNIGRVIARPFIGQPGSFKRTGNRRDYSIPPPGKTLLDIAKEAGNEVISIGKIADIFAHQGITQKIKADGNRALFEATLATIDKAPQGALVLTNFVDFDSVYGHRRDVSGYAHALELFDKWLPELHARLKPDDLVLITADHGCDPTKPGSDHTREHVPVLAFGPTIQSHFIGRRETFADMGQSIADYLGLPRLNHGVSFMQKST